MTRRPLLLLGLLLAAASAAQAQDLTLQEARDYMISLINRDRASVDPSLAPVQADELATTVAQQHVDEMAAHGYVSHWDLAGRKPIQRYNEAGGTDQVTENVYIEWRGSELPVPGELLPSPTFTREEIERVQSAFFNEVPPFDGHRRAILDPNRTHVGIGLARTSQNLAVGQEFIDRLGTFDPLPNRARVGQKVRVSGELQPGLTLRSVAVGWEAAPRPMTVEQLMVTGSYGAPEAYASYYPPPFVSAIPVQVEGQRFSIEVPLERPGAPEERPGAYYFYVWVSRGEGGPFRASTQVVVASADVPATGDVDGSGGADIRDVLTLLRAAALLVTLTPDQIAAGDLNGDGRVTIQDAVLLLRRVAGLG